MTDATSAAPQPAPDKASLFEDFIDIFHAPARVFARRAKASPTVPFLIVCIVLIGLLFVNRNLMQPIIDAEIQRSIDAAMKANPQMTAAQAEQGKGFAHVIASAFQFIGVPVAILVLGLLTMVVGKILGGNLSYGTGLLIASFAWVPRIVESISISIQGLMMDTTTLVSRTQLQFGVGRLLDPATASAGALQLAARVDLFTLWVTVLLAIGLVHAGKIPRSKGVLAGVLVFAIGSLPALFQFLKG